MSSTLYLRHYFISALILLNIKTTYTTQIISFGFLKHHVMLQYYILILIFVDMLQIVIFKYISDTVIINYNVMKQSYIFVIIYIGNHDDDYIQPRATRQLQ